MSHRRAQSLTDLQGPSDGGLPKFLQEIQASDREPTLQQLPRSDRATDAAKTTAPTANADGIPLRAGEDWDEIVSEDEKQKQRALDERKEKSRQANTIRVPPAVIRDSRAVVMWSLIEGMEVDDLARSATLATPNKPCLNVGCSQMHLPEDCPLEPLCGGCGAYKAHFSHECGARCTQCRGDGHTYRYCRSHKVRRGRQLRPRTAVTPLRPNDPPRQIGSVMERIWAEVAKYRSAAADSSVTQDPVPGQDTIRAVSGDRMARMREKKCPQCNKTGHVQADCLFLCLREMWRARKLRDEMKLASLKTVRN